MRDKRFECEFSPKFQSFKTDALDELVGFIGQEVKNDKVELLKVTMGRNMLKK